jgi:hypothetical protein
MRRLTILCFLSVFGLGLLAMACSSDDDDSSGDTTPGTSETTKPTSSSQATEPAPDATSDDGSSTGGGDVNVELTGVLEASWGSDAVVTCTSFGGQLNVSIADEVDGQTYSLVVAQLAYTPGAYFLPESNGDGATTPSVQIVTPSDSSLQWDMGLGVGDGSVSLGGGTAEVPLLLTIDGDLADKSGGDPVHVTADVTCDVTIS